jgi:hypothetical protein
MTSSQRDLAEQTCEAPPVGGAEGPAASRDGASRAISPEAGAGLGQSVVVAQPGVSGGKGSPAPILSSDPVQSGTDFAAVLERVETAAREWGLRPDHPEGQFVSALMGAIDWTGRVIEAAQAEFKQMFSQNQDTAEKELERARLITKAADLALSQARSAQISLQVEQENLVYRMVKEVLPLFLEKLQGALVVREKSWNEGVSQRRYAMVGLMTLGVFLGGYAACSWQDRAATTLLSRCMAHQVPANDRLYCDVSGFGLAEK